MKKYISILASLLLLAATSCIQETVPGENFVTDDQLASSEIGVKGLMNAVYTTLASVNPFGDGQMSYGAMKQMLDHGTSSLLNPGYNGFNTMLQYSYGNFSYANRSRWPVYLYYTYIRAVNDISGLYPEDAELTETQKGYVGQCYAFRALFYMEIVQIMEWKKPTDAVIAPKLTAPKNDLTNLGVPIVTDKTTGAEASNNPRPTVDENYDLIAYDKEDEKLKHFRVDKMEDIAVEETRADSTKAVDKFDLAVYTKQVFGMYGGETVSVKLRFDDSLIGVVVDRFSDRVFIQPHGDGTFTMSAEVMLSPQFFGWLFSFGDKVQITSPKSAKQEFNAYLDSVKAQY